MKKRWVPQQYILHWFWDRTSLESLHELEYDDELVEWCWQNNCRIESRYVVCPDEETFTMFALKWCFTESTNMPQ